MAVAPLFVADMDTLKLELRLQGMKTGSEGDQILSRATSAARVYIYQRLGATLTASLVAMTDVDNPTTADEIRRKAATLAEVEIIRCNLIELMPVMLGDASGDAMQTYNDEGVWRQIDPEEREEIFARCAARVEELLELLLGEELGDDLSVKVYDGRRSDDVNGPCYPGGTAYHIRGPFPGNFTEDM